MKSPFTLPEDRLASTTASGGRVKIYVADFQGVYRRIRSRVQLVLMALFLGLPWVSFQGKPLLRLDIIHRHFYIFGLSFSATDIPILFFVLTIWVFLIAVVTMLWGRVWCGWACPQTVFVEGIYRRIERWIEGNAHSQRRRDQGPWTAEKIGRKTLKTLLYLGVSLLIANSFLAYFVGPEMVIKMMTQSPLEHPFAALLVGVVTAIIWFDFGVFREQFCIIACPYGRLQSVLMDQHSVTVLYDEKRGEPRSAKQPLGDCIDCYRCVQVCPTGVDIRRGTQMECIGCTACIDACNTVMKKIGKPQGLVRYDRASRLSGEDKDNSFLRYRGILYGVILAILVGGLWVTLALRKPIGMTVLRSAQSYTVLEEGHILNVFNLHVYNRLGVPVHVGIETPHDSDIASVVVPGLSEVAPYARDSVPLVIRFNASALVNGKKSYTIIFRIENDGKIQHLSVPVSLLGPITP